MKTCNDCKWKAECIGAEPDGKWAACEQFEEKEMNNFKVGEYIIYHNGEHYELGRIKSLQTDGAFVAYHSGETGAKTPYDLMHKLVNGFVIEKTLLGGLFFEEVEE